MGDNLPIASGIFAVGYLIYSWLNPTKETKPDPLEFEQNNYSRNTPVAIIYGTNKVNPTVIYIGNVYSIYEESSDGGKGGGGSDVEPGYRYYVDAALGIGEGVCAGILNMFVDEFYIQNLNCDVSTYTYEFKTGSSSQIVIPEIEAYLADKECTAIPWKDTSYLFLSGYSKSYNRVPNITMEVAGIGEDIDLSTWTLSSRLNDLYPLFDIFQSDNGNIYFYFYNISSGIAISCGKYGTLYPGVYYYDSYNDTCTLIKSQDDLIGLNAYFHTWSTYKVYDRPKNRYYFFVTCSSVGYPLSKGGQYSIFYIDCDTNNIVQIIKEYQLKDTDWDIASYYRLDLNIFSGYNQEEINAFIVTPDGSELWFSGGEYHGWAFIGRIGIINLITGEPGDPDTLYRSGESNKMWWANTRIGFDGISFTSTNGLYGACNFYTYEKLYFNDQKELWKISKGQVSSDYTHIDETGEGVFYISSRELFYSGSWFYLKMYGLYAKDTFYISLYKDDCIIYTESIIIRDSGVHMGLNGFDNKVFFYHDGVGLGSYHLHEFYYDLKTKIVIEISATHPIGYIALYKKIFKTYNNYLAIYLQSYSGGTSAWFECDLPSSVSTPIWCLYDFLTNTRYGCGISPDLIDGDCFTVGTTFYIEDQYCKEYITDYNGIYGKRFIYDRAFDQRMKAYDIIADILQTCRGFLYYSDGLLKVKIQKNTETPVFYLGFHEENFIVSISPASTSSKIYANFSDYPIDYWKGDVGNCFIDFEQTIIGGNECVGGTATASDNYGGYTPDKAFGSVDCWASLWAGGDHWLQYTFLTSVCIGKIQMQEKWGGGPTNFKLYVSATGSFSGEEVELLSKTGLTWTTDEKKTWTFSNSISAKYYRFTFSTTPGQQIILCNVEMYGTTTISISEEIKFIVLDQAVDYIDLEIIRSSMDLSDLPIFTSELPFTLVKDNIKKDTFQFKEKEYSQRHNKVKLSYINREDNYRTDVIEVEDTYWINELGEILEQTYQMDGIKRNSQARRIAQYLLDYETNINWSCSFDMDILGLFFDVGDIVGITWEQLDWQAKYFRIVSKEEMDVLESKLELLEYVPSVFHDEYCSYAEPNYELVKSRYTKPKNVERVNLFEDYNSNKIYIFFTKSDYDLSFWIGVQCYIKFEDDDDWTSIGILNIDSPSAILSEDITISTKDIAFTGINGSFTSSGSFVIGLEEIGYSYIDTTLKYFYNCNRGFNNTDALVHYKYDCVSLKQNNTPYYEFASSAIGKLLYVKLVSVTSYGLTPDDIDNAPMKTITINGYYSLPPKVDNFRVTIYSANWGGPCNITLGWVCKSKVVNVGYGKDLYGDKYGYGLPTDIEKLILYIYDHPGSNGGDLARMVEINITDYENPPSSYYYSDDMNRADHGGSRVYHFEFVIFQKDFNGKLSRPSYVTTW